MLVERFRYYLVLGALTWNSRECGRSAKLARLVRVGY